jgi:hypothetical protein
MNEAFAENLSALGIAHEFQLVESGPEFSVAVRELQPLLRYLERSIL